MTPTEALAILRIALELAERMAKIAQQDPAIWETIKAEYNSAVEDFKDAPGK